MVHEQGSQPNICNSKKIKYFNIFQSAIRNVNVKPNRGKTHIKKESRGGGQNYRSDHKKKLFYVCLHLNCLKIIQKGLYYGIPCMFFD